MAQVTPSRADDPATLAEARIDPAITDVRRHTARGTILNSSFSVGFALLGLLQKLAAAAFLTTEDFGLWAVILTVIVTLGWLKDLGVGAKFVQQDEPDQELAFQKAFTLELAISWIFVGLLAIALPLYALAYGRDDIIVPGLICAATVPLTTFELAVLIPYRRLQYLRHRLLAAVNPLVTFLVTVTLAVAGAGYWCFVWGAVAGAVAGAVVCAITSPYRFRLRYDHGTLREYARFSWPLLGSSLSRLVVVQGGLIAISRTAGLAAIGAIGLATGIAMFADRVDAIVSETIYPAVCAVADRTELLFEAFVKSNRIALMWGMPWGVALALFADDLVQYVFGPRWELAVMLIAGIGLTTAVGQVAFNWTVFQRAVNDTRPLFVGALLDLASFVVITLPAILLFGLEGWVIGFAASVLVQFFVRARYMRRLFGGFSLLRQFGRAVAPVIPASALVLAIRALGPDDRSLGLAVAELTAFLVVAAVLTFVFERKLVLEVVGYVRRRAAQPA